ncbi:hypothetical protein HS088_TW03G00390 [Tripterygium wilfordii]|uniref:Uncharacterized protein n=1 Tax=Tripterygium wilfordii TaxID=458696 RepID=A0A7J7DUU6_TRIWF|nr:hypothetical protein HS088_TW03G00390 [Tripterygium wilfordii]
MDNISTVEASIERIHIAFENLHTFVTAKITNLANSLESRIDATLSVGFVSLCHNLIKQKGRSWIQQPEKVNLEVLGKSRDGDSSPPMIGIFSSNHNTNFLSNSNTNSLSNLGLHVPLKMVEAIS